jgi:hypothetical protein
MLAHIVRVILCAPEAGARVFFFSADGILQKPMDWLSRGEGRG